MGQPLAKAELNARQEAFVLHYLDTRNATEAAKRAGYSEKTAYSQGFHLLKQPEIKRRIETETTASLDRLRLDRDAVLRQLARIAFGDVRRLFHPDGSLKAVHELDDDTAAMVASIEASAVVKVRKPSRRAKAGAEPDEVKFHTVKYRRVDPTRALHLLGIHHQVFKDQPVQNTFVQFIIQD